MSLIQRKWSRLWQDEEGMGTLEIILIIAVIVIIAVAFRKWIISWIQRLLDNSNSKMKETDTDTINVPAP